MRRKLLIAGGLLLTLAVATAAWVFWPEATQVSLTTADQIKVGMTLAELKDILGPSQQDRMPEKQWMCWQVGSKPPRIQWAFKHRGLVYEAVETEPPPVWGLETLWISRSCVVKVCFSQGGQVVCVQAWPAPLGG